VESPADGQGRFAVAESDQMPTLGLHQGRSAEPRDAPSEAERYIVRPAPAVPLLNGVQQAVISFSNHWIGARINNYFASLQDHGFGGNA